MDVANSVADVIYRLGFVDQAEQTSTSWVTAAELYQWADEAGKRLARETGAFITIDDSIDVAIGTPAYSLPENHVFTLAALLIYPSGQIKLLRMSTVRDLWALDGNWQTTVGDPRRASLDAGAVGTITLYPLPIAASTLWQVIQEFPATIASGSSTISLPAVMQDFFSYRILAGARAKESPNADAAMSQHYAQRADLYTQIAEHLWGPGQ